ncbi:NADH-ubiquinone oxidoreductase [Neisseria macacae ATCC 33926]|uniref:NADH-ubiquinone oxidoreductase n=1 Tax=Neisseria macacae ATCC 33926 TaxID=997348 RepID=A0AA36XK03_9NEIS|nr:NADH-ubiquinone oxidoreductase [Neisseria macacae ATCC 33926]
MFVRPFLFGQEWRQTVRLAVQRCRVLRVLVYVSASFKSPETVFSDDPYPRKTNLTIGF